jgi:peptidoglycan-associated lipoprotein
MTQQQMKALAIVITLGTTIIVGACNKRETQAPPRARPPADQSASIWVDPGSISADRSASLTWRTTNATDITIEGIGAVQPNGSQSVSPAASTTYRLTAKGAGGTMEVTTRLNVTQPPSPPPISHAVSASDN